MGAAYLPRRPALTATEARALKAGAARVGVDLQIVEDRGRTIFVASRWARTVEFTRARRTRRLPRQDGCAGVLNVLITPFRHGLLACRIESMVARNRKSGFGGSQEWLRAINGSRGMSRSAA
jgi:hypothetical protein